MKPLFLLLTLATAAAAAEPAGSCGAPAPGPADGSCCCAAVPASAYSRRSLYQADVAFTTDGGRAFRLGELRGRPVVVALFFASCGYACPLIVADLQAVRARLPDALRERAAFVLVSFDVARDTPAALARYREQRGLDAGWILLHGPDDSVRELAALLGVKYKQEADGGFAHSNLFTILDAEGEIVHQRVGLKGGLDEAVAALAKAGTAR
ncbi:MAG: SCO family protein [Opitutaceae bacterium]|nr:SCO family protein [Opitutaceae bacterium]